MSKSRNPIIEFDKLQMYFGIPYEINTEDTQGIITVIQPSILDIVLMGETKFYSTLNLFVSNTTTYRSLLWQMGIDWNQISDFEAFIMMYKQIDTEVSTLLFKDLDWNKFEHYNIKKDGIEKPILYDKDNNIEIDENIYFHFSQYLRSVFNMNPEEKITTDPILKRQYIEKDKRQQSINEEKKKNGTLNSSSMLALISSCLNHPGFKYDLEGLKKLNVCQFYDSIQRLQIYEQATACLKGLYSGFVSGKDIPADNYNFMKEI